MINTDGMSSKEISAFLKVARAELERRRLERVLLIDGQYNFRDIKKHFNSASDFKSEKELCDYIEDNIKVFCLDIGINYKTHERESYITKHLRFANSKPKIDFLIQDQDGEYILLEVKKPRYQREAVIAISQILEYTVIAEREGLKVKKSYILTTKCENDVIEVIQRFNLPIDLILFSKKRLAIWDKEIGGNCCGS